MQDEPNCCLLPGPDLTPAPRAARPLPCPRAPLLRGLRGTVPWPAAPRAPRLSTPRPTPHPQGFTSDLPGVPGYDNVVLSRYFNEHLPRAAAVAEQLRQRGGEERLVFLTHVRGRAGIAPGPAAGAGASTALPRAGAPSAAHLRPCADLGRVPRALPPPAAPQSWVVSLFLDCPARIGVRCPNATAVAGVRAAIQRGDITWHALPHNGQARGRGRGRARSAS